MSNVIVNKEKIDLLANAISAKSGEALTLTLDEMVSAVDGIETGGGGITPTGNIDITSAGTTDVTNYATATVPSASFYTETVPIGYSTENNNRVWKIKARTELDTGEGDVEGWISAGYYDGGTRTYNAIASGTSVTPTESAQTIGGANVMMESAVTVNAIPSNYVGSGITQRTSSDLSASGATVTAPSGYYASSASKSVASGTEGTPTITVGSLSRGERSITASVTNTAGYISGGTLYATPVVMDAYDFVSGSDNITQNGTYDVAYLAEVVVAVQGGGSSGVMEDQTSTSLGSSSYTLTFSNLLGEPTSFVVMFDDDMATPGGTPYRVVSLVYDGTSYHGQTLTNTNNAQVSYDGSNFTSSYSNGTLTITSSSSQFITGLWVLSYTYGGSASNIHTSDVQVGSGATSITFTNLEDEPLCWSLIFKSNFGTSSGYQRVICTSLNSSGTGVEGLCMDSQARYSSSYWSYSYNNGSLNITSQGTNAGGYFHQPGYYQLTYAISGDQSLQTKTVTPTESTQNVTADTAQGYTALKKVVVNPIPSSYVQPTATKGATTYTPTTSNQTIASGTYLTGTQTISGDANLVAGNIKSGTTIFGVTGTYSGGGGGTDRLVLLQTTSLGTLSTSSTSATDTGKTVSLAQSTGWQNYDLLLVDISVDTTTNGRHTSTVSPVILTGTSAVSTKNTYTVGSNVWNSKLGSTGTASSRQSTTKYGVYINSASVSSNTLTLTVYYRYNSNNTGTLNGTYTARVYGINLIDLIGG